MRLYYPNLIDTATITGSSQASSSLSASNVAHFHRSKVWRTGTSSASESVTFDLGSSQAATAAIIFAHTLLNTDSTIQLRKSTDNFAANDVLVGTFTWASTPMLLTFSSASSRYWRIVFTKASAGVSRDIGRIFLGTYTDFTGLIDWDGFQVEPVDLSERQRMEGAQVNTAIRSQFRKVKMDLGFITQTNADLLKTFSETVGTHTPFFVTADVGFTDEAGEIFYVQLSKPLNRDTKGMGTSGSELAWASSFEAEEVL